MKNKGKQLKTKENKGKERKNGPRNAGGAGRGLLAECRRGWEGAAGGMPEPPGLGGGCWRNAGAAGRRGHSRELDGFQEATEASFRSVGSRRGLFTMRFGGSTIGLRRLVPPPEVGSGEGVE